jgi:hypothetical protein
MTALEVTAHAADLNATVQPYYKRCELVHLEARCTGQVRDTFKLRNDQSMAERNHDAA